MYCDDVDTTGIHDNYVTTLPTHEPDEMPFRYFPGPKYQLGYKEFHDQLPPQLNLGGKDVFRLVLGTSSTASFSFVTPPFTMEGCVSHSENLIPYIVEKGTLYIGDVMNTILMMMMMT